MNFIGEIGSLTLPQIQEYLSGQRPFPGGQMALTAHLPTLAAQAVRMKMRDGGEVPQIDSRMQALLMQRFAEGGKVSKYGYVIAYDAMGKEIGTRKDTDPPFTEEATTKPAGMYAASDAAQPGMFTSIREKEKYMEGKNKAAMTPINMAKDAIGGLTDLIGMNTKPWAPSKPDMAALNKAIDEGKIPPMPPEVRAEQEAFRQANNIGSPIVGGSKSITSFGLGDLPALPDTKAIEAALEKRKADIGETDPAKIKETNRGILGIKDRSEARLKDIEALKSGLESDRELGKWMAIAQFASGMAGKRNLAEGMAGGIEKGVPAFAATQAAYRKGMSEAADKQMRIEDAADAIERELGTNALNLSDKRKAEIAQIADKRYGIKKDIFNAGLELYKARTDAAYKENLGAYYKAGGSRSINDGSLTDAQIAKLRLDAEKSLAKNYKYTLLANSNDPIKQEEAARMLEEKLQELAVGLRAKSGANVAGSGTMPSAGGQIKPDYIFNPKTGKLE